MKRLLVGKIVNTFGIHGELKIVSRFEYANKVFIKGNYIYIDKQKHEITGERFHKKNYLTQIDNLKDINLVEALIGKDVYFNEEDLNLTKDEYILSELINFKVIDEDGKTYQITDTINDKVNPLIKVNNQFYIPIKGNYIIKVDKEKEEVYTKDIRGLML